MNKGALACIVVIVVVFVGFVALTHNGDDGSNYTSDADNEIEPTQDSKGKVSPTSDLTLYYNNDMSVYGYFSNDVFQGVAYYNDAFAKGTIKMNLSKVKWDKNYTPSSGRINNVSYAEKNFLKDVRRDYKKDNVTISANLEFLDSKGKHVDLEDVYSSDYSDGRKAIKISLKKDILTLKVNYRFETNETQISNDIPYDGALAKEPSDFDKASKVKLRVNIYNDDYDYSITSTLKDDKFSISHL